MIIRKYQTKKQLVDYLYYFCGSPCVSTFLRVILQGNITTWPGISSIGFNMYLTQSIATVKGNLNQEQNNLSPQKQSLTSMILIFPITDEPNIKIFKSADMIIPCEMKVTAYYDLTGCLTHKLSRGN